MPAGKETSHDFLVHEDLLQWTPLRNVQEEAQFFPTVIHSALVNADLNGRRDRKSFTNALVDISSFTRQVSFQYDNANSIKQYKKKVRQLR